MISVSINMNGNTIMARSAVNQEDLENGKCRYDLDDGSSVVHDPDDGAVALAKKLLDQIEEVERLNSTVKNEKTGDRLG